MILKITQPDAKKLLLISIGKSFLARDGYPDLVSGAKNLSTEEKIESIKQLMQLAKEYTSSQQFKTDYKKWRNEQLNPQSKGKLGIPKFGKMLENKIDNQLDKAENEKKYPSDPNKLVKKRLTDFLAISELLILMRSSRMLICSLMRNMKKIFSMENVLSCR